jgi:7,8-dihydropterin-6-yl-methyl-4-(beta-D-ribofuranosyl)aminobenzene 5'-phosphate synthase
MKKLWFIPVSILGIAALLALIVFMRQAIAKRDIQRAWNAPLPEAPALATTSQLEIIPLYEKAGSDDRFILGHGVSYLVRTDASTILLDIGNNPDQVEVAPYMQNMQALNRSWDEIDAVFVTHPHPDHVGGVQPWKENTIAFGEIPVNQVNVPVFTPSKMAYPDAIFSPDPVQLGPDVASTGVIAYTEVFPLSVIWPRGGEQALVVHVEGEGLIVITGCGHPGLEKLVARAETLYEQPVVGVAGGLHYTTATEEDLTAPIRFLQAREPRLVALSPHDSGPAALAAFDRAFPDTYETLRVGDVVRFP